MKSLIRPSRHTMIRCRIFTQPSGQDRPIHPSMHSMHLEYYKIFPPVLSTTNGILHHHYPTETEKRKLLMFSHTPVLSAANGAIHRQYPTEKERNPLTFTCGRKQRKTQPRVLLAMLLALGNFHRPRELLG